jgi:hypothetical protein
MRSNSNTSASWPAVKILPSTDRSIASQLARKASNASKSGFVSFTASSSISPDLGRNSTKGRRYGPLVVRVLLFPSFQPTIGGMQSFALCSLIQTSPPMVRWDGEYWQTPSSHPLHRRQAGGFARRYFADEGWLALGFHPKIEASTLDLSQKRIAKNFSNPSLQMT